MLFFKVMLLQMLVYSAMPCSSHIHTMLSHTPPHIHHMSPCVKWQSCCLAVQPELLHHQEVHISWSPVIWCSCLGPSHLAGGVTQYPADAALMAVSLLAPFTLPSACSLHSIPKCLQWCQALQYWLVSVCSSTYAVSHALSYVLFSVQ